MAKYAGPGEPININHVRRLEWPLDIILPVGESFTMFETPVLHGVPAVLYYPKPGSSLGSDQTVLEFAEGEVETIVVGDDLDPQVATRIALSLICGASCASAEAAVASVSGQAGDESRERTAPDPLAIGATVLAIGAGLLALSWYGRKGLT